MTSNIGSEYLLDGISSDGKIKEETRNFVMSELRRRFKPEFLNRIDEIVMFKPLTKEEIIRIIDLSLEDTKNRLEDRGIKLEVTEKAKIFIAKEAYSPIYGARPVKRYLQKYIETSIAKLLISGDLSENSTAFIDVDEKLNEIIIQPK